MSLPTPPTRLPRARGRRGGQTLTEFGIIVFLVAVGTIGVVVLFGDNLRQLFGGSSDAITGGTRVQNGGGKTPADLSKWSMKGQGEGGNPGGITNKPGNPGGTSNMETPGSGALE